MTSIPAIPDPPQRLSGPEVELVPIRDWDIPEILIAHQDDRELATSLGLVRAPSGAELGQEVEAAAADWAAGTLKLTLLTPGSEDCRGRLVIDLAAAGADVSADGSVAAGTARATVWVVPQYRGRGLARAALALAGDWLASAGGIHQLQCGEDRPRGG